MKENPEGDKKISTNGTDWLERYYSECGREISLAFNGINTNTNWALTLISAVLTGIILSGAFPTFWTWSLLIITLLLTIRFFVRTCLAYSNLIRWNRLRGKINDLFLFPTSDVTKQRELLLKNIKTYDTKWFSPIEKKALILSNIKYGYWYLFTALTIMIIYGLVFAPIGNLLLPSYEGARMLSVGFFGIFVILLEIKLFHSSSYFEYLKVELNQQPIKRMKGLSDGSKAAFLVAIILIAIAFSMMFFVETQTLKYTSNSFDYLDLGFQFSQPFILDTSESIHVYWESVSPMGVGLVTQENALKYNETRRELQSLQFSSGLDVSWDFICETENCFSLYKEQAYSEQQFFSVNVEKTRAPYVEIGLPLLLCSLVPTIVGVVLPAKKVETKF